MGSYPIEAIIFPGCSGGCTNMAEGVLSVDSVAVAAIAAANTVAVVAAPAVSAFGCAVAADLAVATSY
jgi:hypothetical protein